MLITAAVGMGLVPYAYIDPIKAFWGIIGIGFLACSGGIFNQVFEYEIDRKMSRTQHRPLVSDAISKKSAILIACAFIIFGSIILYTFTTRLTLYLTIFTMIGYSYIYTKILKPITSQNIVIGGLFGAMPPLLGWTALTGSIHALPLLLVAIIFTWTPSHFWALSLAKIDDYKQTPLPMLPITHGIPCTQIHILAYTVLLIIVTQLPYLLTYCSLFYLITANLANIFLFRSMYAVYQSPTSKNCWLAFKHSNIYLLLIFIGLLLDNWL